jgi:hypothetical protein
MQAIASMDPNEFDPSCPARSESFITDRIANEQEAAAFAMVGGLLGGRTSLGGIEAKARTEAAMQQDGVDDAYLLVSEYGGCSGAAFNKVYATLKRYVTR